MATYAARYDQTPSSYPHARELLRVSHTPRALTLHIHVVHVYAYHIQCIFLTHKILIYLHILHRMYTFYIYMHTLHIKYTHAYHVHMCVHTHVHIHIPCINMYQSDSVRLALFQHISQGCFDCII